MLYDILKLFLVVCFWDQLKNSVFIIQMLYYELAKAPVGGFTNSVVRNLFSLEYGIVTAS